MTSRQLLWAGWLIVIAGLIYMSTGAYDDLSVGDWKARLRGDRVQIELKRDPGWGSRTSFGAGLAELDGVGRAELREAGRPLTFRLVRDAGTIVFEGEGGRRATGSYTFEPSEAFVRELEAVGERYPDEDDLFLLVVHDAKTELVRALAGFGYDDLDASDIVRLFAYGVELDYISAVQLLGYRPSVDQIVRLRSHGVRAETIERYHQLGLGGIVADDVIRLKNHGVQPDWVRAMSDVGFGTDDVEALVRLRAHGVPAELVAAARDAGLRDPSVSDVIRLRNHGIDVEALGRYERLQQTDLGVEQLVRLKSHGIPTDYLAHLRGALPDVSVDEVIRLYQHGVPADYVTELAALGVEEPTSLIRLRTHGVASKLAVAVYESGYGHVGVDGVVRLRSHGVEADFVRRLAQAGYTGLDVEEMLRLHRSGLDEILSKRQD